MFLRLKIFLFYFPVFRTALTACLSVFAIQYGYAQTTGDVVAKVNGIEITKNEIATAKVTLEEALSQVPNEQRDQLALSYLIETEALSQAAVKAGVEEDNRFKQRFELLRKRALQEFYLEEQMAVAVNEEAIQAFYNENVAKSGGQQEVKARHILLKTKEEAQNVMKRAKAGEDFAALAQELSTGPSGSNGGDLGYFTADKMVAPFSEAAFKLAINDISDPVETQFGWHIIKVEDKRAQPIPSLEELKGQIASFLAQSQRKKIIEQIIQSSQIEVEQ